MDNQSYSIRSHPRAYRRHLPLLILNSFLCHAVLVCGQSQVEVDDTDPDIEYDSQSGWVAISNKEAFDGTEHLNRLQGGTANFTFNGHGVSVFGTIVPQSTFGGNITQSTYFLDDEPGMTFTVPGNITAMRTRVLFYQSPGNITNGTHTLRIVNDNEDDWYLLDFLQILVGSSNSSISSQPMNGGTASPGSAGSSLGSSPTISSSNSHSLTISNSNDNGHTLAPVSFASHGEPISPGAAVGIAFSCAVVLGIGAALVIIICNRRRRRKTELDKLTAIDPFVAGFIAATHEPKGEFTPPASFAAAETSAQGMFYPYLVEFFSRSRGPRSLKSIISPSKRSARSGKLNISPMTQSDISSSQQQQQQQQQQQPVPRTLPTQSPVFTVPTPGRKSTKRSTKLSFLSNLNLNSGYTQWEEISPISRSTTEVQMGIAL